MPGVAGGRAAIFTHVGLLDLGGRAQMGTGARHFPACRAGIDGLLSGFFSFDFFLRGFGHQQSSYPLSRTVVF